jgi:hypothetical protein
VIVKPSYLSYQVPQLWFLHIRVFQAVTNSVNKCLLWWRDFRLSLLFSWGLCSINLNLSHRTEKFWFALLEHRLWINSPPPGNHIESKHFACNVISQHFSLICWLQIYNVINMQIYYCIYTSNVSRQENWNLLLYKEKTVLFKIPAETKQTKNITNGIYHT